MATRLGTRLGIPAELGITRSAKRRAAQTCPMPSPRRPLPRGLEGTAFTVAQGRSIGLGQSRMRGSDLKRPFRGVRVTAAGSNARGVLGRCAGTARRCLALSVALLPGAFFSHLTAARLWPLDLPMPDPLERIHVSVRRPARPPRRFGVTGHLVTTH